MRFLCDEMLARLARLLRAAGHDTALAEPGAADAALLVQAEAEDRRLVTRDRELARKAGPRGVLIRAEGADAEAAELTARLDVDWRAAPFTRCVMDNTPLMEATAEQISRIPEKSQGLPGPFRTCPSCGRLYWPGSHVRRMAARLLRYSTDWHGGEGKAI